MNRIKAILILSIPVFLKSLLYAEKGEVYEEIEKSNTPNGPQKKEEILFGGTLLSYTAHNVPARHLAFEQFFIFSNAYGLYNNNSKLKTGNHFSQLELLPYLKFGIIENLDLNIITSFTYSFSNKSDATSLGDTLVLFGIQLMHAKEDSWMPDMRLLVGESFPTGRYDKLKPKMNGGDGVGSGSFETTFILSLAKVFPVSRNHALRFNPNLYYIIPSNTNISNLSVYGGGEGTRGTAKPGNQIAVDFPCEYNITNHLILGLDIFYIHEDKVRFDSKAKNQPLAGLPSSENFSLAPCLEYNPNDNFGVEGGVWFSVQGRNSIAFTTGIFVAWWYF